jgi:type IV pilus secretin PilQ/predicted competence protein
MPSSVQVAAVQTGSIDFGIEGMPTSLQSGTVLMAVDVESGGEAALVHFHADGELALARTFILKEPARLVVDLPGIRGDLLTNETVLGGDIVVGVRVGVHPDKLRVVIDGGGDANAFANYKAFPSSDGLYLLIGESPELELELESRLNTGGTMARTGEALEATSGALGSGPEPVLVAMRGGSENAELVNPWDEALDATDDAAILARISDPYLAEEAGPGASSGNSFEPLGSQQANRLDTPGSDTRQEGIEIARLRQPSSQAPAAVAGGLGATEANTIMGETAENTAVAPSAVDIWAVEISSGGREGAAPRALTEEVSVAVSSEATTAEIEIASAAEELFLARAGKSVETRISDLRVEGASAPTPTKTEFAQADESVGSQAREESANSDPWTLSSEAAAENTAPSTAAAAPQPVSIPTEIFGLQYDRDETRDRIAILGDRAGAYRLYEPDDETLIIILENATLSEGMGERITPEFGGPISQVTIFQQPDIDGNEVRVVLRRASGLVPDVYQRGSLVLADFSNTAVAASLPVVLIPEAPSEEVAAAAEQDDGVEYAEVGADEDSAPPTPESVVEFAPELITAAGDVTVGDDMSDEEASQLASVGLVDNQVFIGSPISLDFKDVPIMDVLRLIAEVSELNIIAGDEVKGSITLRLVDVPWDQALDIVLVTRGLGYVQVGNVLRIAPAETLQAEEAERLQDRRNKEQLEDLEVKLQPVNYAAVGDVKQLVQRLLSPRGTVNSDERTNTVIIKDIPSVILEATALIEALDTQTPQVMIEAKIVEASLDFGRELGNKWSVGTNPLATPKTGGVTWDGKNSVAVGRQIANAFGAASMGFLVLDDNVRIDVQVEAMEEAGEGKVISSPRVVTLDNREATIEQGVSIPFQTFEGGDAKLEFVDAVLSLKVTPHITPDESIIMALEVTRNAPDSSIETSTGSPAIAKNQAKTETLVKNGQTLVIGGIYTIERATTETRVPYLHKIPVLGAAFKSRREVDSRKELLIFVTPRIVVNPALADL